ncbi:MAG: hypothetical protein KF841_15100 [Phycisphaerae bacterium]|nr:hypothetical protein [Phycisphaerae bacterium]
MADASGDAPLCAKIAVLDSARPLRFISILSSFHHRFIISDYRAVVRRILEVVRATG